MVARQQVLVACETAPRALRQGGPSNQHHLLEAALERVERINRCVILRLRSHCNGRLSTLEDVAGLECVQPEIHQATPLIRQLQRRRLGRSSNGQDLHGPRT